MFTLNCVPDDALLHIDSMEENHKLEFYGVLENLPQVMVRSSMMIVCNFIIQHGGKIESKGKRKHIG